VRSDILLKKNKHLPSMPEIQIVESVIGNRLPDDYVAFMEEYNNFMPDPPRPICFKVDWKGKKVAPFDEASIGSWEEINKNKDNSIIEAIKILWAPSFEIIPHDVIPIGGDGGGGLILLGISGENYGKVFYWFDGCPYEPGEPSYENIGFVANNFTEFLESLYPCDDG